MKVQLLDHEEHSWQRVAQIVDDSGKTQMVYFNWHHEYGYEVDNYNKLPDWVTKDFADMEELAQYLDEETYAPAYNKVKVYQ